MSVDKNIAESPYCCTGLMICFDCKKKIEEGLYMTAKYYNIHDRGNENDTVKVFCYECTKDQNVWKAYFEKKEKEEVERKKHLHKHQLEIIKVIKNAKHISIVEDSTNFLEVVIHKK